MQDEIRKRWMLMLAAATQEKFDGLPCRISGHIYDRDLIVYRGEPRVRDHQGHTQGCKCDGHAPFEWNTGVGS